VIGQGDESLGLGQGVVAVEHQADDPVPVGQEIKHGAVQCVFGMGHGRKKEMKQAVCLGQHEEEEIERSAVPAHFQGGPPTGQGGPQFPGEGVEIRGAPGGIGLQTVAGQTEILREFGRIHGPVEIGFREAGNDGPAQGGDRRGAG